jgi:hypothetical protein
MEGRNVSEHVTHANGVIEVRWELMGVPIKLRDEMLKEIGKIDTGWKRPVLIDHTRRVAHFYPQPPQDIILEGGCGAWYAAIADEINKRIMLLIEFSDECVTWNSHLLQYTISIPSKYGLDSKAMHVIAASFRQRSKVKTAEVVTNSTIIVVPRNPRPDINLMRDLNKVVAHKAIRKKMMASHPAGSTRK